MNHIFNLDTSGFSKELVLMLEMLKQQSNDEVLVNENLLEEMDWELFIQLTRHHRVYPTIYQKIKLVNRRFYSSICIRNIAIRISKKHFSHASVKR